MAKAPKKVSRPWLPERKSFDREVKNEAFYNSWPWRKLRKRFKENNPLCKHCEENGFIVPMKVVDHIVPIKKGGEPLSEDNLQSLCEKCHNKKSSNESRGMG